MGTLIKNGINYTGGVNKYSTNEQIVGEWIDGKAIYRKVIVITEGLAKDNPITVCNIPTDMDELVLSYGLMKTTEGSFSNNDILVYSNANNGTIVAKQNFTSYPSKLTVVLEYTKK